MRKRRLVVVAAVLLIGCAGLRDLLTLSGALQKQFGAAANVNLSNGSHLIVTFPNLPEETLKAEGGDRAKLAADVAHFVKVHYAQANELNDITVAFAQVKSAGPLTMTRTDAHYSFAAKDLK